MEIFKKPTEDIRKPFTTVDIADAVTGMTIGMVNTKVRGCIKTLKHANRSYLTRFIGSEYVDPKSKKVKLCYCVTDAGAEYLAKSLRGRAGQQVLDALAKYKGDK